MNDSRTISADGLVAGILWGATIGLLLIAGAVMMFGQWKASILIAETACCVSAWAAVRHLRCYAAKICRKIEEARQLDADIKRVTGLPAQRPSLR